MSETQRGYFLLADISGYTSFVAGTELEHSHEILSGLLTTICENIESLAHGVTRIYEIMKLETPLPRPLLRVLRKTFAKLFEKSEEKMLQSAARLLVEEDYARSKRGVNLETRDS